MSEAAHRANDAVTKTMRKYRETEVTDEDDITGVLVGRLDAEFDGDFGGLTWSTSILRHRKGEAGEESKIGADLIIHVALDAPPLKYSKAVLVQAKRLEPGLSLPKSERERLLQQCDKMLDVSPASYVFNFTRREMRCDSAANVQGRKGNITAEGMPMTSLRFFLGLFRCSIGDPRYTSAKVSNLIVPNTISIVGVAGE